MNKNLYLFGLIIFYGIFNAIIATTLQMNWSVRSFITYSLGLIGWIFTLVLIIKQMLELK